MSDTGSSSDSEDYEGIQDVDNASEMEEVLPINESEYSSCDDEFTEEHNSDPSQIEDELVSNHDAWGKRKSTFFHSDFVDEDRGRSYREEDRELAKAEEIDGLEIQRKYLRNLHTSVFETSTFISKELPEKDTVHIVGPDWSSISKNEKLKIMKKKCPELITLIGDFKAKLCARKEFFQSPSKSTSRDQTKGNNLNKRVELLHTMTQLYLHYIINLSFYMYMKTKGKEQFSSVLKKSMVIKKFLQFAERIKANDLVPQKNTQTKIQKFLLDQERIPDNEKTALNGEAEDNVGEELTQNVKSKRSATYDIVKNKGLMSYRRKEYRNPRVRQRIKFKKAEIRRKGQIKKPREEIHRYGGEFSGIHPNVTRSIKVK